MRVGTIGLIEAGNLGDDLIFLGLLDSINASDSVEEVIHLSFGEHLDVTTVNRMLGLSYKLTRNPVRHEGLLPKLRRDPFGAVDIVFLGGGGLIQDVHHPFRPFHWLRYMPSGKPVVCVGIGIGPLSNIWQVVLSSCIAAPSAAYLRDHDSRVLAERFGWTSSRCSDFVQPELIRKLVGREAELHQNSSRRRVLGVSIRDWPGLSLSAVVAQIDAVLERYSCDVVEIFVLESKRGTGVDVVQAKLLRERLSRESRISIYDPSSIHVFMAAMSRCTAAVSMKLHASAIWGAFDIPIYPIVYAPKVAAMFDRPYIGLEIVDSAVAPVFEEKSVPSADEIVARCLVSVSQFPFVRRTRTNLAFELVCEMGSVAVHAFRVARSRFNRLSVYRD